MEIQPVKIGEFSVAPFFGVLYSQLGLDTSQGMDADFVQAMAGSPLGKMMADFNLEGKWPPTQEARENLKRIVQTIENAEAKTGVKFNRQIIVTCDIAGPLAMNGQHDIQLDYGIVTGQSPLTQDAIEAILIHEAGHIKNRDHEHVGAINQHLGTLQFIGSLSDFYREEPDKFAHIVKEEFGSVEAFRNALSLVLDKTGQALEPVETHPAYEGMTDIKMLKLLYKDADMSHAMLSVQPQDASAYGEYMGLALPFTLKSEKQRADLRKSCEAMGVSAEYKEAMKSMLGEDIHFAKADDATRKRLDALNDELLTPAKAKARKLAEFRGCYSRASEFRADDVVVINATHPEAYVTGLRTFHQHMQENPRATIPQGLMDLNRQFERDYPQVPLIRPWRPERTGQVVC